MLRSQDGKVFYREWKCPDSKAVIILAHGMGGYSGRFFEMGPYLAKNGFQAYAIEQKGHGESPSIKGHISNFKLYTEDLRSLVAATRALNSGKKVFLFGESMGGLITIDFCIHHQDIIDGVILMSPAVKDKLPISLRKKAEIFKAAVLEPMGFFPAGFSAGIFTRDPEMAKRIDADPLEVRCFTAKFFISIIKAMAFVNIMARRIKLPVFMMLAGKDAMISAEAAEKYFKKISSKDKQLKWYPEMYHALYVDKDRDKVFADILDWLGRHT
ncbi:alpha/beta hydrolase [Candidatus Margulisiibacteriota bacterium]